MRIALALLASALVLSADAESEEDAMRGIVTRNIGVFGRNVNPSYVIEPLKGPWKNNPLWGKGVSIAMPLAEGVRIPIFEAGDIVGPPRVQTILVFRNQPPTLANSDIRALVEYGTGAIQDSFELDWQNGSQFSIVANFVRISAVSFAPNENLPYAASGNLQIGAGVAEGTAVSSLLPASRTTIDSIDPAAVADYPVPAFAKAVMVWSDTPAVTVSFHLSGGVFPYSGTAADFDIYRDHGMALPGSTVRVRLTNPGGLVANVAVQFFLGL